ncbi:hypothetical protein KGF56_003834 [Candida oxycetoniae]|uniref:Uncharacterized protein n=1 Tax=Candida oxycetoniae TaxID=497107 RepID=A0AAI9WWV6_9ASCO|nr:uncharacterized protein KGF56_003834 [Candida oxycetoniae]KAI3403413.2 hypothetical protein KGF56_003834 [Candida oxycetoniae]
MEVIEPDLNSTHREIIDLVSDEESENESVHNRAEAPNVSINIDDSDDDDGNGNDNDKDDRGDRGDRGERDGRDEDDDDDIIILSEGEAEKMVFKSSSFDSTPPREDYTWPKPSSYRWDETNRSSSPPSSFAITANHAGTKPESAHSSGASQSQTKPESVHSSGASQSLLPGSSYVPPQVYNDLVSSQREILKKREHERLLEINRLIDTKRMISAQMQLHQTQFDSSSQKNQVLQVELNRAMSMGNHTMVNDLRRMIAKVQHSMEGPRTHINTLQRQLLVVESSLSRKQNELSEITTKLRNIGHAYNALFNPYEAEINRDFQELEDSDSRVQDVDLQILLDNIRPDESTEEEGLEPTPPEMAVNLLKHQRIGLSWLKRMESSKTKGGILADDMGLGKTIQILALIVANKSQNPLKKTTLIVAPVSLLRQWMAEIQSKTHPHCELKVGIYHGDERKSLSSFTVLKKFDIVLTSYGTLSSEWKKHFAEELQENKDEGKKYYPREEDGGKSYVSPFFDSNSHFYRIVLDEAQNIKNKLTVASKAVNYLKGEYRFCLSGTPMQNSIEELYPIIRFLKIRPYFIEQKFRVEIVLPIKSNSDNYNEIDRSKGMKKLRALLSSILLRRNKNTMIDGKPLLQLPEKHIVSNYVELEGDEMLYYKGVEQGVQTLAKKMLSSSDHSHSNVLTLLLRLRQACCHSYLVEIGKLKTEQKLKEEDMGYKLDLRKQLRSAYSLKENVKNIVKERICSSSNGQLACPVCFDTVDEESKLVLFSECGHLICHACIDTFFDNNLVEEEKTSARIAECLECKTRVRETNLCDYAIFEKLYIKQLDIEEVENYCRSQYNRKQISNMSVIKELTTRDEGFEPSAKIEKSIELINQIHKSNPRQKIIIFSQFTTLFDLMKLVLDHEKIPHLRYDGSMSIETKNSVIKKFYQSDNDNVLLLSLRAGNVGLTLTCANHVVIMDPFWNPFVEEQAMDRAHRIGQEREVYVHRILIANTVESRIMELQKRKKELIGDALDETEMKSISKLGRRELGFLFGLNQLH